MGNDRFNILYFSSFANLTGGGQVSLLKLVSHLDRDRYQPYVVVPGEGELAERLRSKDIPVIIQNLPRILPFPGLPAFKSTASLLQLAQDLNIHLLHTDGPRNTLYAGVVKTLRRIPLIWHIRASSRSIFDRVLFLFCDRLVLVADRLRERFAWVKNESKLVTVHNGIDLEDFSDARKKNGVTDNRRNAGTRLKVGMIGRVETAKGQKHLIEAGGRLNKLGAPIDILIIGETTDPAYAEECLATARAHGIEKNVHFLGYRKDIGRFLNKLDIFAFTSTAEAFPRTIIEAMGAGLPVITTDVGGCPEAVEDGVTGYVIPAGDPAALAEKIAYLVKKPEARLSLGQKARKRAGQMFSIEKNVKKIEKIYTDLLHKMPLTEKSAACHLCGHNRFMVLEGDQLPNRVLQCRRCGLVFVWPYPGGEELAAHYDGQYYTEWIGAQRTRRVRMWKKRLERISRHRPVGTILDVGCGEGLFLQIAQKNGWRVRGTELSNFAAGYASDRLGDGIYCGEIIDGGFEKESCDVVTMWHVLEHVKAPLKYLTEIRKIIKDDGLLVIAVPNVNNLLMQLAYRVYKRKKLKLFTHGAKELHLYHFSVDTLTACLSKAGFQIIRVAPDFGTISVPQQAMNVVGAALYYGTGLKIFNAMEIMAKPQKPDSY